MKNELTIFDFNSAFVKLEGDHLLLKKIQGFFEVDHPNKYMVKAMARKYGAWNGKVKLFKLTDNLFPIGYMSRLNKICRNTGINIRISKKAHNLLYSNKKMDKDELRKTLMSYFDEGFLNEIGGSVYEHQIESAVLNITEKRGLIDVHTRGGKSAIIFMVIKWLYDNLKPEDKIVLIVPRIHLTEQMFDDIAKYIKDKELLELISVYHSQSDRKDINKKFQITTYQSFVKNKHVYNDVKAVLVDEVHEVGSGDTDEMKQLHQILDSLTNAEYRLGYTGTLPDEDDDEERLALETIIGKFGRVLLVKDLMESIEQGIVTDFKINISIFDYMDEDTMYENAYSDYQNFCSNMTLYNERPYIIPALIEHGVINKNAKIFTTFNRIDSLEMFMKFQEENMKDVDVYRFDGKVSATKRKKVIESIKETDPSKCTITNSTLSVMNAGITVPNLDTIIFCEGSKKASTIRQAIGRSVGLDRNNPNKMAEIVDVVDYVKYKRKEGYSLKHLKERLELYNKKGFKYCFHYFKWFPEQKKFIKMKPPAPVQNWIDKY